VIVIVRPSGEDLRTAGAGRLQVSKHVDDIETRERGLDRARPWIEQPRQSRARAPGVAQPDDVVVLRGRPHGAVHQPARAGRLGAREQEAEAGLALHLRRSLADLASERDASLEVGAGRRLPGKSVRREHRGLPPQLGLLGACRQPHGAVHAPIRALERLRSRLRVREPLEPLDRDIAQVERGMDEAGLVVLASREVGQAAIV